VSATHLNVFWQNQKLGFFIFALSLILKEQNKKAKNKKDFSSPRKEKCWAKPSTAEYLLSVFLFTLLEVL